MSSIVDPSLRKYVAGVDSSTQSTKVRIVDPTTGNVIREGRASHPEGTEVEPRFWWDALLTAISDAGGLDDVAAISVAGQQHGMVLLNSAGEVIRPALLWNDVRSAPQAEFLNSIVGDAEIARRTGSKLVASFTATKVRWVAENEPENAAQIAAICLPHDWLSWKLLGTNSLSDLVTDRSEASGTGYFNPVTNEYDKELLGLALNNVVNSNKVVLPRVLAPQEIAGTTKVSGLPQGIAVGPGAGDNAGAALGLSLIEGDVVVSLGTSGTAFTSTNVATHDELGYLAGFANCEGEALPLVCTLNAARVFDAGTRILGVNHDQFAALALKAEPGAGGLTLLPYFEGERTPNRPQSRGVFDGFSLSNATPENMARAMIEGVALSMVDAVEELKKRSIEVKRVLLIGGAAKNPAVQEIFASMFGGTIYLPEPDEYVANGAARQAAWIISDSTTPPAWKSEMQKISAPDSSHLLQRYLRLKSNTDGWSY
jgi:xylulokinase